MDDEVVSRVGPRPLPGKAMSRIVLAIGGMFRRLARNICVRHPWQLGVATASRRHAGTPTKTTIPRDNICRSRSVGTRKINVYTDHATTSLGLLLVIFYMHEHNHDTCITYIDTTILIVHVYTNIHV